MFWMEKVPLTFPWKISLLIFYSSTKRRSMDCTILGKSPDIRAEAVGWITATETKIPDSHSPTPAH